MTSLAIRDETTNSARYLAVARVILQAIEINGGTDEGLSIVAPPGYFDYMLRFPGEPFTAGYPKALLGVPIVYCDHAAVTGAHVTFPTQHGVA